MIPRTPKTIKSIPLRKSPGIRDAPMNEKKANIKKSAETRIEMAMIISSF